MTVSKITSSQTDNDIVLKLNSIIDALGIKSITKTQDTITWLNQDGSAETFTVPKIPEADSTVPGIAKLYVDLGQNTDGAVTQKTVDDIISAKNAEISDLKNATDDINTDIETINNSITSINADITNMSSSIENMDKTIAAIKTLDEQNLRSVATVVNEDEALEERTATLTLPENGKWAYMMSGGAEVSGSGLTGIAEGGTVLVFKTLTGSLPQNGLIFRIG